MGHLIIHVMSTTAVATVVEVGPPRVGENGVCSRSGFDVGRGYVLMVRVEVVGVKWDVRAPTCDVTMMCACADYVFVVFLAVCSIV